MQKIQGNKTIIQNLYKAHNDSNWTSSVVSCVALVKYKWTIWKFNL